MLTEGLRLLAVGMVSVFAFLTLMVGAMRLSAAVCAKLEAYFPEKTPPAPPGATGDSEAEIALAIAVARTRG
jgi:Na+-transporting methylmalonyl-CoA/oxaloacetate decarboxylase gamma subunit